MKRHLIGLWLLVGCDVPADVHAPSDAGPGSPAPEGECWRTGLDRDPVTAVDSREPTPQLVQCKHDLVYAYNRACVQTPTPGAPDGIDNDCDGCIDESGEGCCGLCGGYPVPPAQITPKPSAFTFRPEDEWHLRARATGCTDQSCEEDVGSIRYFCDGGEIRFQAQVVVLARNDASCLRDPGNRLIHGEDGRPVCGLQPTLNWLEGQLTSCNRHVRSVRLSVAPGAGGLSLSLARLESNDPAVPPMMTNDQYAAELTDLFHCVQTWAYEANQFGDRTDADADHVADVCEDADGDGIPDAQDDCPGVANAGQADTDRDGIGDACCGDADPDADGVDNCDWRPDDPHPQRGAPRPDPNAWPAAMPGTALCRDGVRVCVPRGTWPADRTLAQIAASASELVQQGTDVPRPTWLAASVPWPPTVRIPRGSENARLAECYAREDDQVLGGGPAFTDDQWDACLRDATGDLDLIEPARAAKFTIPGPMVQETDYFGVYGEWVVWFFGGYAREQCSRHYHYNVNLDGRDRKGEIDIYCRDTKQLIEVKWYNTFYNDWPVARMEAFYDQVRRHFQAWRALDDGQLRLTWMFGFNPPPVARDILEHAIGLPATFPPYDYPPVPELTLLDDWLVRMGRDPWSVGRVYWQRFIPVDFTTLPFVLDEGPCADCTADDPRPICTAVLHDPATNTDLHLNEGPYIDRKSLRTFIGIYLSRCARGDVDGCDDSWAEVYDGLNCTEY
jgi:hypothetical protein